MIVKQLTLIDITRLTSRKKFPTLSGIDRVILAYSEWLELREAPPIKLRHDFYSLDDVSNNRRKGSFLSKVFSLKRRIRRSKLVSECSDLINTEYEQLQDLDISTGSKYFKIDNHLTQQLEKLDHAIYFSIGHDVLIRHSYLEWLKSIPLMKKVFFIHDTIPLDYPEYCRHEESGRHKLRIFNAHIYGDLLIVNSHYTAERLEYWRKSWGLRQVPVQVINIGVETIEKKSEVPSAPPGGPYFVVLGTIEPRKNHLLLLNVWRSMLETCDSSRIPKLLIIGRMGWEVEMVQRILDRNYRLHEFVKVRHDVKDEDMWPILQGANALLFPSFVEGWGMPLVEALHNGVPAICSDIPALREAGQDLADYCSPLNGEAWKDLIMDYVENPEGKRAEQIERIKKFKAPTWQKHFEDLKSIINNIQQ